MTTKFWYVYKRNGQWPPSYKHTSYDSALQEAQRLVGIVGGEFEIFEAVAVVREAPKYVVESLPYPVPVVGSPVGNDDDHIPF